jgi:hypothetical protein
MKTPAHGSKFSKKLHFVIKLQIQSMANYNFFFYKLQTTISESNPTVINYINLYFCTPYAIPMGAIWLHLN